MNHLASSCTRLLIRPEHVQSESLRGYVSRVSSRNGVSPQLKPMLTSLQATTDAIEEIATLTGCSDSLLRAHGSRGQIGPDGHSGVLFGSCTISIARIRTHRRMICPMCLAKNGISTCCWELRDYDVCHEHGCYLVGRCNGCDRFLSWSSTSSDSCSCGTRHADIETEMAPINRRMICKLIGDAMLATIDRFNQRGMVFGSLTPLHWFFAVSNFVRSVLIPGFCQEHLGFKRPISKQTYEELLLVILKDSEYCGHLRQVILRHAVGNPITMAQPLRSGLVEKEIRECFLLCLENVTLHSHLFKIKADVLRKRELDFQPAPEFIKWTQRAAAGIT